MYNDNSCIDARFICNLYLRSHRKKKLEEQEGSPDPMPTKNHLKNKKKWTETQMTSALKEAKQSKIPISTEYQKSTTYLGPYCRIV